jgi:hypothetical protein
MCKVKPSMLIASKLENGGDVPSRQVKLLVKGAVT